MSQVYNFLVIPQVLVGDHDEYVQYQYNQTILYNTGECPLVSGSQILHLTCSAYISCNNGRILMYCCLNNCINLPNMIGTFANGANTSLVAKIELKNYSTTIDKIITSGRILAFEVSIQLYQSARHDKIIFMWRQCLLSGQNWN